MSKYKEEKMCFMTVANKPYQKYIPWYLYFLNRAYPKAYKLILLDGKITDKIKPMITLLSGNFEIRENVYSPAFTNIDGDTIKCLRWLTYEPKFEEFDCMSIGDIDMAIYKESPSYMEQHLAHCDQLGIPYSNFMRPSSAGPKRVGGINVIKPREWFNAVIPVIKKYLLLLQNHQLNLPSYGMNEQLLLKIIQESSLGQPPDNLSETYWSSLVTSNHHGTHIRLAEHGGIQGLKGARNYQFHKSEILAAVQTSLFEKLSMISPQIADILGKIARAYERF